MALVYLLYLATIQWPVDQANIAMCSLLSWMVFSKFIKLITHFARYPVDILLWPVSVIFGWVHGSIKWYALATLSEVSQTSIPLHKSNGLPFYRQHGAAVLVQTLVTLKE